MGAGNSKEGQALCELCEKGNSDGVRENLDQLEPEKARQAVRYQDSRELFKGDTPLHHAARCGNVEIASICIEYGGDINSRNEWRETPMHLAALKGHKSLVEFLLQFNVHIMAVTKKGKTAVEEAEGQGHSDVAALLRDRIALHESFAMMKTADLRAKLEEAGVSHAGVNEKDELIARIIISSQKANESPELMKAKPRLLGVGGRRGTMRDAVSAPRVRKEGLLIKKGGKNNKLQERFCVLDTGNTFAYFKSEADLRKGGNPKGFVDVSAATLKMNPKVEFGFIVSVPGRDYELKAADEDDLTSWCCQFELACGGLASQDPDYESVRQDSSSSSSSSSSDGGDSGSGGSGSDSQSGSDAGDGSDGSASDGAKADGDAPAAAGSSTEATGGESAAAEPTAEPAAEPASEVTEATTEATTETAAEEATSEPAAETTAAAEEPAPETDAADGGEGEGTTEANAEDGDGGDGDAE